MPVRDGVGAAVGWIDEVRSRLGVHAEPAAGAAATPVPPGVSADLASVPRVAAWLAPRQCRYAKAVMLRDHLRQRRRTAGTPGAAGHAPAVVRWTAWAAARAAASRSHLAHGRAGRDLAVAAVLAPLAVVAAVLVVAVAVVLAALQAAAWSLRAVGAAVRLAVVPSALGPFGSSPVDGTAS